MWYWLFKCYRQLRQRGNSQREVRESFLENTGLDLCVERYVVEGVGVGNSRKWEHDQCDSFVCQCHWTKGFPDIWPNIILGVSG